MENHEIEQIETWRKKAEKWDALAEKIGKCYTDDEGNVLSDEYCDENGIDLGTIGEIAAIAFGYL